MDRAVIYLNLGCGDAYVHGWVNVDHEDCPYKRDETLDLTGELPWTNVSVAYLGHLLEHLTPPQCLGLLTGLCDRMVPGGMVMVVGPDVELAALYGTGPWHTMDQLRHGADRWGGDVHHWECTTAKVIELLVEAGWSDVTDVGIENVPPFWPVVDRRLRWQLAVGAHA